MSSSAIGVDPKTLGFDPDTMTPEEHAELKVAIVTALTAIGDKRKALAAAGTPVVEVKPLTPALFKEGQAIWFKPDAPEKDPTPPTSELASKAGHPNWTHEMLMCVRMRTEGVVVDTDWDKDFKAWYYRIVFALPSGANPVRCRVKEGWLRTNKPLTFEEEFARKNADKVPNTATVDDIIDDILG